MSVKDVISVAIHRMLLESSVKATNGMDVCDCFCRLRLAMSSTIGHEICH